MYRTTYGPKVREAFFNLQTDSRKRTMTTPAIEAPTREATTAEPLLFIDSLSINFGDQQVLRNISLELTSGESLVILGESGCGKTVLLKTMIGLIQPTTGDVRFENTSLASMTERQLAHLRTRYGFVFQGAALFDSATVAENIAFPLREHTQLDEDEILQNPRVFLMETSNVFPSVGSIPLSNFTLNSTSSGYDPVTHSSVITTRDTGDIALEDGTDTNDSSNGFLLEETSGDNIDLEGATGITP